MHEIYNFALHYVLTISPTICQIKSLSLHFFSFQKYPFLLFTKQIKFCGTDYGLSSNLVTMFFKVKQYGYETFENVTPILQSLICSDMNTDSVTNKMLLTVKRKG